MAENGLLNGKRILIVDDEPDVLDTLEELLSVCDVVKANNFEDAKRILETQQFDITILDIMGVNGYDLLSIAVEKKIIPVMLTAHALSPENTIKSFKEKAASYIPKDEMANIVTYLNDILEAKEKGESPWWRWFDRLGTFFTKAFGPDWEKKYEEDFREELQRKYRLPYMY